MCDSNDARIRGAKAQGAGRRMLGGRRGGGMVGFVQDGIRSKRGDGRPPTDLPF
jgi:hypothetical protein